MSEWLRRGLQNRLREFDSLSGFQIKYGMLRYSMIMLLALLVSLVLFLWQQHGAIIWLSQMYAWC